MKKRAIFCVLSFVLAFLMVFASACAVQGEQGEKGEQGVQGIQGIQGEKGDTGARGPQGEQGEKGEKGDTGAQGPQGEQGEKGEKGKNAELRTFGSETEPFKGEFIGDGHTISNFSLYADAAVNYYGLFAVNEGTIANVKFDNATLNATNSNKAERYIGLVCAYNKGTVKQVYCNGQITFSNNTKDTSYAYLGEIAGANEGNIENCMTCGKVTFKANPSISTGFHPNTKIGGISGKNSEKISKCLSSLSFISSTQYGYKEVYFCGISGENSGTVEYCLFSGTFSLKGSDVADAIATNTGEGKQTSCYRAYTVTASGGMSVTEEYLNDKNAFYVEMLGWSESVWDLSDLNFAEGRYPTLR